MKNIEFKVGKVFRRLQKMIKNHPDKKYLIFRGGTSSGKTISILQWLVLYAFENPNKTINIITESMVKAKRGLIPDMQKIVMPNLWQHITFNKTESYITFPNKSIIRFISAEDPMKVVGLRSDILYADEVDGVDNEVITQLSIRTRDKIIASFNPRAMWDWYEDVSKKATFIEDVSTYLDNDMLEQSIVDDLLDRAKTNYNFKKVYINGEFGTVDGLVFEEDRDWFIIDSLPEIYDEEIITLDFGFRHMTGVVKALRIKNDVYLQQLLYKNDMITDDLAREIWDFNPLNIKVVCDSEDAQQIATLKRKHGIHALAMKKLNRPDSIDNFKGRNVFITSDSVNLIKEMRNYHYDERKKDKKNRPLPEKVFDDLVDPARYAVDYYFKKGVMKSKGISIRRG